MGNWRHILKNLLLGTLLLVTTGMLAQEEKLGRAQQLYRAKDYENAARAIDSAIVHPQTSRDFITWTTRAYVYYYIYIRSDKAKFNSKLRDTVLISIRKSITLNPDSDYTSNNKKLLVNLAAHYFNIAKTLLQDSLSYDKSLQSYNKYKELIALTDASYNVNSKDVEYYLAVGSVYSEIFGKQGTAAMQDTSRRSPMNIAKVALLTVLDVQPDNPAANMNLGLLYYNQAVNMVKDLDIGADFDKIDAVQENIIKLAKQAEGFIYRVYKNDNKNKKACTALFYIYRMLNDIPKSEEFKKKAEDLGEKFTDESKEKPGDGGNNNKNQEK
jgi:hypothetical protein